VSNDVGKFTGHSFHHIELEEGVGLRSRVTVYDVAQLDSQPSHPMVTRHFHE
jgi:hypothetical protein